MTREEIYDGVFGMQVNAPDNPRAGLVDDGLIAHPERVQEARRYWLEGRASDFEMLDRRGRRWKDRATGAAYRRVNGCAPILSPSVEAVDVFFVQDGTLTFLIRDERPRTTETVISGEFYGARVVDGRIIKKGAA